MERNLTLSDLPRGMSFRPGARLLATAFAFAIALVLLWAIFNFLDVPSPLIQIVMALESAGTYALGILASRLRISAILNAWRRTKFREGWYDLRRILQSHEGSMERKLSIAVVVGLFILNGFITKVEVRTAVIWGESVIVPLIAFMLSRELYFSLWLRRLPKD
ncbi:MAG: hypothetical protein ACUVXI_12220 [bacterium]